MNEFQMQEFIALIRYFLETGQSEQAFEMVDSLCGKFPTCQTSCLIERVGTHS